MPVALFVIGSGRSGTSLCALSLHAAGLALPSDLAARRRVKRARWLDRECRDDLPLVVKDPWAALFLGDWLRAARTVGVDPVFVIMNRDPAEVTDPRDSDSTAKRSDEGLASWINMSLLAEQGTRGFPRLVVNHRDLVRDPVAETARMLDLTRADHTADGRFDPERALSVVDPASHRDRSTGARCRVGLGAIGGRLHEALLDLGVNEFDPAARRSVDAIAREYRSYPSVGRFAFGEPGALDRLKPRQRLAVKHLTRTARALVTDVR